MQIPGMTLIKKLMSMEIKTMNTVNMMCSGTLATVITMLAKMITKISRKVILFAIFTDKTLPGK